MSALTPALRDYLKPGLAGAIASTDATGNPQSTRVWAVRALADQDALEIYVLAQAAQRFLASVAHGGRASLNLVEVTTYRSRAFKGRCGLLQGGVNAGFLQESLSAMDAEFHSVGLPSNSVGRMLEHFSNREMVALLLEVDSVFDQSPKPGAGARL